jgi:hypothetical protein
MAEFKDRGTGLVLFGVLQILIGLLALLACAFLTFSLVVQHAAGRLPSGPLQTVGFAFVVYGAVAAFFVTMGVGSIQARRWARALMLITSWVWLITGVFSIALLVIILPRMMHQIDAQAEHPAPGLVNIILIVAFAFSTIFYILLPLGFLLFYRTENVKLTCEFRHPQPSWTDRVPLPVLALCILKALGALSLGCMAFAFPVFVFFGLILHGPVATVLQVVLALVWAFLAYGLYRLRPHFYWATIALLAIFWASTIVSFLQIDLIRMYEASGTMSEQQLNMVRISPMFQGHFFLWMMVAITTGYLGFVLYLRKYFRSQSLPPAASADVAI